MLWLTLEFMLRLTLQFTLWLALYFPIRIVLQHPYVEFISSFLCCLLQYKQCSSVLSVGGIRQQFSLPENIQMSMYTAEFLSKLRLHLTVDRKLFRLCTCTQFPCLIHNFVYWYTLRLYLYFRVKCSRCALHTHRLPVLGVAWWCWNYENQSWDANVRCTREYSCWGAVTFNVVVVPDSLTLPRNAYKVSSSPWA